MGTGKLIIAWNGATFGCQYPQLQVTADFAKLETSHLCYNIRASRRNLGDIKRLQ